VRATLVEAMKQHRLVEEKVALFWQKYAEVSVKLSTSANAVKESSITAPERHEVAESRTSFVGDMP
jgi:hypothetical protein